MRTRPNLLHLLLASLLASVATTASAAAPGGDRSPALELELDPKERVAEMAQLEGEGIEELEAGPTALDPESLIDLDDPAAPLHFEFPDLERLARPTGFSNVSEAEFDVVLYRSGRQIYLYVGVEGGAASEELEAVATFWEHETDAGIPDRLRAELTRRGAPPESAEEAVTAIAEMLERPYRWQALCFSVEDQVDIIGVAGAR
jgi:hypothetical protein